MAEDQAPPRGAAFAIAQVHYYGVAVVGIGLLIWGAITALMGVRNLIFPSGFFSTRVWVRQALTGLAFAAPGLGLAAWHLREARIQEKTTLPAVLRGKSLYYHLVATISVLTLLGGVIALLTGLVDWVLPTCLSNSFGGSVGAIDACYPSHPEALRALSNALIILLVAGGVWVWHIRRARALGAADAST